MVTATVCKKEKKFREKIIIFDSQTVFIPSDFKIAALKIHLFKGLEGWFLTLREDTN